MTSKDWKEILTLFVEAGYTKILKDIPDTLEGLSPEVQKTWRRKLKRVRRHAAFDLALGVGVVVGNGAAATLSPLMGAGSLATSASGGVILLRRATHALIETSSRG
jgi:hypothetical protein